MRIKSRQFKKVAGCDLDFNIREYMMAVGIIKSGGLNSMNEQTAKSWYKIMNINRDSKLEKYITEVIQNRPSPRNFANSSFDGENQFHDKITRMPRQKMRT